MTDRFFIEDQTLVKKFLDVLTPLNEHSGWQSELYIDSLTQQKWERYLFEIFDSDEDGIGLRKYPYPSTKEIIGIAMTSKYYDEVDGACALLIDMEYDKTEFREELLLEIEKNIDIISKERYEIIYNRAELNDTLNKREILGKNYQQIEADTDHYKLMMMKAEKLKKTINGK